MIKLNHKPNILVIGDLMIDEYLWGSCDRISPEAPVPVANIKKQSSVLGGAGNVVNNLVSLNADVTVMSVIGDDEVAEELKGYLEDINAKYELIGSSTRFTSKKTRIMASNQQVIRFDKESLSPIEEDEEKKLIKNFFNHIQNNNVDIVILSDYGKGVLTKEVTSSIIKLADEKNIKVIVDPKGGDYSKYSGAYLLTPNKKEASLATNIDINDESSLKNALEILKNEVNLAISLITLSEDGIAIFDDKFHKIPTVAKEVYDVTGAGDTVIASLAIALSQDYDITEAVRFANLSAGVVVGKIGSATVNFEEIHEYESSLHKSKSYAHVKSQDELEKITAHLKDKGKKIVFTNGCFDILHRGHVDYLETSKSFGDVLIIGLNSDKSVKKLKGEDRPINTELDRAYLLASLEAVDFVAIFDEDTPYELISKLQPNILVKGGDYEGKVVVGSDIVDEVRLVEFIDGRSTTSVIQKIRNC
jgi:D-beta-D-heptose 7-phosphate kinase/D-beta-D-heptose 1-phosphate adenosyltransferase